MVKSSPLSDIHGCLDAFLYALSFVDLEDKNNMLVLMYETEKKKFYEVTKGRSEELN